MSSRGAHIGPFRPRVPSTLPSSPARGDSGWSSPAAAAPDGRGRQRCVTASRERAGPHVEAVPEAARNFISDYCTRCHNDDRKVANLDLKSLAYDPADAGNFARG